MVFEMRQKPKSVTYFAKGEPKPIFLKFVGLPHLNYHSYHKLWLEISSIATMTFHKLFALQASCGLRTNFNILCGTPHMTCDVCSTFFEIGLQTLCLFMYIMMGTNLSSLIFLSFSNELARGFGAWAYE